MLMNIHIFGVPVRGSGNLTWVSKVREDFRRDIWERWQEIRLHADGTGGDGWDSVGQ